MPRSEPGPDLGVDPHIFTAAPLTAMGGNLPTALIRGNTVGTPASFLIVMTIIGCFTVGFGRLSSRIVSTGAFYTRAGQGLERPAAVAAALISLISIYVLASLIAARGLWIVWRDRYADRVEPPRQIRRAFTLIIAPLIVSAFCGKAFRAVVGGYELWRTVNAAALVAAILATAELPFGLRSPTLIDYASGPAQPPLRQEVDERLANKLDTVMRHKRLYRELRLTIGGLAVRIGEREYRLREHINAGLGFRNFKA